MQILLLCIIIAALQPHLLAQSALFSGVILDNQTKRGIEGATIYNKKTTETVLTNDAGVFILRNHFDRTDTLEISAIGFETVRITCEELTKMKVVNLSQKILLLQELVIANSPASSSQIISKIDIKMRGINNSQEALRMIPGLFIGQHAGGGKAEQIFLRGFDLDHGTDINISVDGMPVNLVSHAHSQGYSDLHFVIPELIDRIHFRKGTYYP
ncbi:MAG: TonB-dependent receptor plug domain-containing protein, partial [Flavisolibacter sp.]|nr:TonB-dependent receptor plug domain-containing protein [Flavisolibacter sp.]